MRTTRNAFAEICLLARLFTLAITTLLLFTNTVLAQFNIHISQTVATPPRYQPIDQKGFGLAGLNIKTIVAWDCLPTGGGIDTVENTSINSGDAFVCGIDLPSGARITAFSLEACDSDPAGEVAGLVASCPSPDNTQPCTPDVDALLPADVVSTGVTQTPGCGFYDFNLPTPITIENSANTYFAAFLDDNPTPTTNFRAMRIHWQRQISPAPVSATFNDVPTTHPFFRSVEAMAASGITGGCGAGNYCPDDPLTRGQMAAFLARALGLHFSN